MDIKPIKTKNDYKKALAELDRFFEAKPNTPDGDYVEVLAALVEKYESEHFPIGTPDPIEALEYFMESRGLSRTDLEEYIGGSGRVSDVLNRKRGLSLNMIRKLHFELGVPAEALLRESRTKYSA
jgi:HTH-type transcriptional regulator/antitoxin HigA